MYVACGISWSIHYPMLLPLPESYELVVYSEPTEKSPPKVNPDDVYTAGNRLSLFLT